jgi:DeoR family transcriptional regulator, aga operon transcriptional repressor
MPVKQSPLLVDERRREIVKILRKDGRLSVEDLVRRFKVSAVTIRTDLSQLAEHGILVRSYGGAIAPQEPHEEFPLNVKRTINHAEKVRIGRAAAQLIQSGQTVILDSGTTSAEVARAMKRKDLRNLTVITHALNIAQEFIDAPQISVIMIGGVMRHVSGSFVGPQAERMIRELHADHLFLGVDGLDPDFGPSTPDLLEAQINQLMMQASQQVTVIADASKIGRRSLSVISDITHLQRVITDNRIGTEVIARLRQKGVEVLVV